MTASAVGGNLSSSIASLATAQGSESAARTSSIASLKMAQNIEGQAVLSLLEKTLGLGRNLDIIA